MKVKRGPAIWFSLVLTSVTWIYPASASDAKENPQMVPSSPVVAFNNAAARTSQSKLIVDSTAQKWSQFQHLAEEWKAKRGATSSITEMSMMEPYQKIIGMGESAVPLILAQLKAEGDEPDQWFWALRILTDANPVKPQDQGDFLAMSRAWIDWGTTKDYAEYAG